MKILIFGGTTEGRILAEQLCRDGHSVAVSCTTELGIEQLHGIPCGRLCGRIPAKQIGGLVRMYDLVIDATHPYAAQITKHVREACDQENIPLKRVLRTLGEHPNCIQVQSCAEAAGFLQNTEGNILVTTGSKELAEFGILSAERVYARVLPTHSAIDVCESIGLPHRNILALQGPFSQELNAAMLRQYRICWLVTKNGGTAGGFSEKIAAAQACGVKTVLIEPPEDSGISLEDVLKEVRGLCM